MATTPTFPAWLKAQEGRGDDVASFAQQVAHLTDFPDSGGKAIYDGYFETALTEHRDTYERAWSEYSASPEPRLMGAGTGGHCGTALTFDLLAKTSKHLKNEEAPAELPPVLLPVTAVGKPYLRRLRAVVL